MAKRGPSPIDRSFLTNMDGVGTLLLVRHGQQQWPDPKTSVAGDWVDPPLSDLGNKQAACVGEYLAGETPSAVYSSQLVRANETGKAVAAHHDLDVIIIEYLAEIHMYGGLPLDSRPQDILGEAIQKGVWERFIQSRKWDSYPDTESSADFRRRVGIGIEAAVVAHPGETVIVACHGGVINAYLADMLGLGEDMFYRPAHASVHRILFKDQRRVIQSLNETHYLENAGLLTN
jgi:probable phosphoglycerate mutase